MIIQVFADGRTVFDSRIPDDCPLLDLKATICLNKAGTAEITMPPGHPCYNRFISYRTVVEIYRDGDLLFRGRALYPEDDFYNRRTIICEGERGFFHDSVMRPHVYQDTPAAVFAAVVANHNLQVDAFKTFKVGTVTVTDPNDYIRLESTNPEETAATLDRLVDRCGGYIVFTTDTEGRRTINWLAELGYRCSQPIEFGENLLDFVRRGESPDMATRIFPYGAKDEETGERITIYDVNGQLDYIQDDEAVALRGIISKAVIWDDVTEPLNLLAKGKKYLATSKMAITALDLSAADLSALGTDIESYRVGDAVPVRSAPHSVDDDFLLQQRAYNLLSPAQDRVQLGMSRATLTGADAAGDRDNLDELHRTEHQIRADYTLNIGQAIESTLTTLATLIQQTSESIMLQVSETYATNDAVQSQISTTLTQLADSFNFEFEALRAIVDANDASNREQFETIRKYIRFVEGDIVLGEEGNALTLRIMNDRISFLDDGAEVAYFSNKHLYVTDAHFLRSLRVGQFAWLPRANNNLSLVRVE